MLVQLTIIGILGLSDCATLGNKPNDITNAVTAKIDNLQSIVLGNIQSSHDTFSIYYSDATSFSSNTLHLGTMEINEYATDILQKIQLIKDLSTPNDVSSCINEDGIKNAAGRMQSLLINCIVYRDQDATDVIKSGTYVVDVTMSQVYRHRFDLQKCESNLHCIYPLLAKIENDEVLLPQLIRKELDAVAERLSLVKEGVRQCRDSNVNGYIGLANELYGRMSECVDQMM